LLTTIIQTNQKVPPTVHRYNLTVIGAVFQENVLPSVLAAVLAGASGASTKAVIKSHQVHFISD